MQLSRLLTKLSKSSTDARPEWMGDAIAALGFTGVCRSCTLVQWIGLGMTVLGQNPYANPQKTGLQSGSGFINIGVI